MSEVTEAPTVAEPEAPAAAPEAPAAPEQAPAETKAPETYREARERVARAARGERSTVASEFNAPRDEAGRFTSETAPPETPAPEPETPEPVGEGDASTSPPASTPEATPEAAPDGPAAGFARIPVPEGHPLRDRGVDHLDFPEGPAAEHARYVLKHDVRKADLASLRKEQESAARSAALAKAEAEFWRENAASLYPPDFWQVYNELKSVYGDEQAEAYKAGQTAKVEAQLADKRQNAEAEFTREQAQEMGRQFVDHALRDASRTFPGWSEQETRAALAQYGTYMEAHGIQEPSAESWHQFARTLWAATPRISQWLQGQLTKEQAAKAEAAAEQARKDAEERQKRELQEAAGRRASNPIGGLPPSATTQTTPDPSRPRSVKEARQLVYDGVRGVS